MLQRMLERGERALAQRTTRRSFIGKLGRAVVVLAGGSFAAAALDPRRAEAYHICGHIYTTGSCPHPFRPNSAIDRYGYPVHPRWGFPVADDGRIYTSRSQRRRKVCQEVVAAKYPFTKPTVLQGTWSRCCGGRIRRVVDCCSRSRTRINGDASLVGYCYDGRRVFCITYRDTKIPC